MMVNAVQAQTQMQHLSYLTSQISVHLYFHHSPLMRMLANWKSHVWRILVEVKLFLHLWLNIILAHTADPQSQEEFLDTHETLPLPCELGFKLVGDNIDKTVRPRYIRIENYSNKSLHYFHSFAVQNRVDFNCLPDVAPVSCLNHPNEVAKCLLPSTNHDRIMKDHFIVIISCILYSNMEFFKASFDGCIEWHIRHKFYQEMCTKSHVVSGFILEEYIPIYAIHPQIPLGITLKNENKLGEMVEIMTHLQKYVPAKEYVKQVSVPDGSSQHMLRDAILHPLLFGGDQLTAARARGAKKIKMNGVSPLDRLEGLVPCAEDWHAKVNLLEVW